MARARGAGHSFSAVRQAHLAAWRRSRGTVSRSDEVEVPCRLAAKFQRAALHAATTEQQLGEVDADGVVAAFLELTLESEENIISIEVACWCKIIRRMEFYAGSQFESIFQAII